MGTTLILHQVVRELLSSVHVLGECSFIEEGFLEQARGAGGQGAEYSRRGSTENPISWINIRLNYTLEISSHLLIEHCTH